MKGLVILLVCCLLLSSIALAADVVTKEVDEEGTIRLSSKGSAATKPAAAEGGSWEAQVLATCNQKKRGPIENMTDTELEVGLEKIAALKASPPDPGSSLRWGGVLDSCRKLYDIEIGIRKQKKDYNTMVEKLGRRR